MDTRNGATRGSGLGTFAGVFTPSILTILGIILFLRLGYVVGNAGLGKALVVIGMATAVSLLTSISLAAIATNMTVKGGGDYYLISRTLGVEFGGAIGVVLFLAQSVSIAFYAIGFGEAVSAMLGLSGNVPSQIFAALAVVALFLLAWKGADVASRFQFAVMAFLVLALFSFYVGSVRGFDSTMLGRDWSSPEGQMGLWVIFAVFFPAVTGFTQGVSMSGDLRDPGKSLPLGTFTAVGLSTIVYVSVAILLAGSVPLARLAEDPGSLRSVSLIPVLIDIGVVAATLSSAMASFLGAPRILQSLASDRIFPILNSFSKGVGPANNPRRGTLVSLAIAMATISLGSLNVIAPVVSMFFLISYGLLNYATFYEAKAGSPSFRPRFRFFHPYLSLAGAVGSFGAMVAISPTAGIVALAVLAALYTYVGRRAQPERWADASHSHYFQRAKDNIRLLAGESSSARNWRPQVLAFSADPARRQRLMRFASWLEGSSGLSAVVQIVQGSGAVKRRERDQAEAELRLQAAAEGVDVSLVVLAPDVGEALPIVVQSFGVGPMRANTVLFGWPETPDADRRAGYLSMLRDVMRLGLNMVAMSSDAVRWAAMQSTPSRDRRIDIWWDDSDSGRLALLLAYLFTRTDDWRRARLRVCSVSPEGDAGGATEEALRDMLEEARIVADVVVCRASDIERELSGASLVVIPARLRREETLAPSGRDLFAVFPGLPLAVAVMAAIPVDLAAGPESAEHSELLAAEERLEAARSRLQRLERQLTEAHDTLSRIHARAGRNGGVPAAEFDEAEDHLALMTRRTLKARAVAEQAQRELERLLVTMQGSS
ncbi:MAG: amino acid permease [Acidimicrobiia bacterium]|nr:amino acid permease [Acidimicrobiia bacterium]